MTRKELLEARKALIKDDIARLEKTLEMKREELQMLVLQLSDPQLEKK